MTDPAASRVWLLSRVDRRCLDAIDELLRAITELLAVATDDAVTVRALSTEGHLLRPVIAYHADPERGSAMARVMSETVQPADSGLWQTVVESRQARRWHIPPGYIPPEASPKQVEFLQRFPIRAVLAVPVLVGERLIGGVSVVRYSVDTEFTDDDEALVIACARRIALALHFQQLVSELNEPGQ